MGGEVLQEVVEPAINGLKSGVEESPEGPKASSLFPSLKQYRWWIQMIVYAFFLLAGQSVGTLLGRVYFDNGGNSEWMATLVQVVGFPIFFPFRWIMSAKKDDNEPETSTKRPFPAALASVYIVLGIFLAINSMLYSIGLQYLPVTTYTLICASQLAFNAVFSYFLNSQKFTPYIINSLVLLTISSTLLVFQSDPGDSHKTSRKKYAIGFLSTLAASALYALVLSITQLAFKKIIKKETVRSVTELLIAQNFVATIAITVGLFASGDWKKINKEMTGYKLGKVSYVMNLFWTAVSWQVFGVGCVGLIFKVSALFSNVISVVGLPVAPILAIIFLHDKLTGLKAISMLLAMWGFVSYMYQHYLDDLEEKKKASSGEQVSEVSLVNERGIV